MAAACFSERWKTPERPSRRLIRIIRWKKSSSVPPNRKPSNDAFDQAHLSSVQRLLPPRASWRGWWKAGGLLFRGRGAARLLVGRGVCRRDGRRSIKAGAGAPRHAAGAARHLPDHDRYLGGR